MLREADKWAGSEAIRILKSRVWPDHAPSMHAEVIAALCADGFIVDPEFQAEAFNGKRGRIDIVASLDGGSVAIELDARKPRKKSVKKLVGFDGFRIVGLRGVDGHSETGIHACVCMYVRKPTDAEKADKRIYRPDPVWAHDWKGEA